MGHTWMYPIRIPLYLLDFGATWVTPNPKKPCSKSKDNKISSIVTPAAGFAASIRPPAPHSPWMRTSWCCGPHWGPRKLQFWRSWTPGFLWKLLSWSTDTENWDKEFAAHSHSIHTYVRNSATAVTVIKNFCSDSLPTFQKLQPCMLAI